MKPYFVMLALIAGCLGSAISASADEKASFVLPSGASVEIVEADFDRSRFEVTGCDGQSDVCLINGRIPFGVDGSVPGSHVKSIRITHQGQTHELDVSDMYNAWGGRPLQYDEHTRYFGGTCFDYAPYCQFRGLFSDAAGSFVAEWQVRGDVSVRTILTNQVDVVNFISDNIDPPEFE